MRRSKKEYKQGGKKKTRNTAPSPIETGVSCRVSSKNGIARASATMPTHTRRFASEAMWRAAMMTVSRASSMLKTSVASVAVSWIRGHAV